MFDDMPRQPIRVRKATGDVLGPYDATSAGGYTIVWDRMADMDEGDTVLTEMPSGKETERVVETVNFMPGMGDIPTHFQITFRSRQPAPPPSGSNNFHFHGSQTVAVGNHNTQTVVNFVEAMTKEIERSEASNVQKAEALTLLQQFVSQPIVQGIIASGAWAGIANALG